MAYASKIATAAKLANEYRVYANAVHECQSGYSSL